MFKRAGPDYPSGLPRGSTPPFPVDRSELKHAERHAALARAVSAAAAAPASSGKASAEGGADPVAVGYAAAGAAALPPFDASILTRPDIADSIVAGRAALLAAKPPRASFPAKQTPPPPAGPPKAGTAAAAPAAAAAAGASKPKGPPAAAPAAGISGGASSVPALAVYTDAEIPALGKCFCTERARLAGIRTYTRALRYYVLATAAAALAAGSSLPNHAAALGVAEGMLPATVTAAPAGAPLSAVLGSAAAVAALLDAWAKLIAAEATAVRDSKARDSDRGRRVVPDYDAAHAAPTPETDGVVRTLTMRAEAAARAAAEAQKAANA